LLFFVFNIEKFDLYKKSPRINHSSLYVFVQIYPKNYFCFSNVCHYQYTFISFIFEGRMITPFSIQQLTERLVKLNNSHQCIESLSKWCITHRKKARQIVESWEKHFNESHKEKQVPLMYLANDISQNSRRKGSEFVNEFWKILPRNLKTVCNSDDNQTKTVAMRLVNIWDDRKVFGSHGRVLKDEMLGKEPSTNLDRSVQPQSIMRILKKDANALRIVGTSYSVRLLN